MMIVNVQGRRNLIKMGTGILSKDDKEKRYREKSKSNGTCIRCSRKLFSKSLCEYHLLKQREKAKELNNSPKP